MKYVQYISSLGWVCRTEVLGAGVMDIVVVIMRMMRMMMVMRRMLSWWMGRVERVELYVKLVLTITREEWKGEGRGRRN